MAHARQERGLRLIGPFRRQKSCLQLMHALLLPAVQHRDITLRRQNIAMRIIQPAELQLLAQEVPLHLLRIDINIRILHGQLPYQIFQGCLPAAKLPVRRQNITLDHMQAIRRIRLLRLADALPARRADLDGLALHIKKRHEIILLGGEALYDKLLFFLLVDIQRVHHRLDIPGLRILHHLHQRLHPMRILILRAAAIGTGNPRLPAMKALQQAVAAKPLLKKLLIAFIRDDCRDMGKKPADRIRLQKVQHIGRRTMAAHADILREVQPKSAQCLRVADQKLLHRTVEIHHRFRDIDNDHIKIRLALPILHAVPLIMHPDQAAILALDAILAAVKIPAGNLGIDLLQYPLPIIRINHLGEFVIEFF